MQIESEITHDLADLHLALQRGVELRKMLGTTPTWRDRVLETIREQSTKIGKTDSLVNREEGDLVNARIGKIRSWVMAHGECSEDGREIYSSAVDNIQVFVDKTKKTRLFGYYLFLYIDGGPSELTELVFNVDFQKRYALEIIFEHESSKSEPLDSTIETGDLDFEQLATNNYAYSSGRQNLEDMDSREFRIISFYLNRFMQAKQIE